MDFAWTPEQRAAYDEVRASVEQTFAPTADAGRLHDRDVWRQLGQLGLLGLCMPASTAAAGSARWTPRSCRGARRGCADTGLVFAAGAHLFACAMPIAGFGSDRTARAAPARPVLREVVAGNAMTEAGAGSDVSRLP